MNPSGSSRILCLGSRSSKLMSELRVDKLRKLSISPSMLYDTSWTKFYYNVLCPSSHLHRLLLSSFTFLHQMFRHSSFNVYFPVVVFSYKQIDIPCCIKCVSSYPSLRTSLTAKTLNELNQESFPVTQSDRTICKPMEVLYPLPDSQYDQSLRCSIQIRKANQATVCLPA